MNSAQGFIGATVDLLRLCEDEESRKKVMDCLEIMYDMSDSELMRVATLICEADALSGVAHE